MSKSFIKVTTLQAIANALRGRQLQGNADKIEVDDFATTATLRISNNKEAIERTISALVIPSNVQSIRNNAFQSCSNLESVTIPSSVTTIGNYVFGGIKSNAVINCEFAQGAVSGAPWGAPAGVTINYGVTSGAKGGNRATSTVVVTKEMAEEYAKNHPLEEEGEEKQEDKK